MAVIIPTFAPIHPFGFVSNESLKFQSEMDNLLSEMRTSIFKSVRDSCTAACKEPSKEPLENSSKAHHLQSQIPRSTFTCESAAMNFSLGQSFPKSFQKRPLVEI